MKNPEQKYRKTNQTTAGVLKSHQLLIERAIVLAETFEEGNQETQVKIQNILSQLQMSLELRFATAREMHKALALLWDVVETGSPEGILGVADVLRGHLETFYHLQGKDIS